MYIKCKCNYKRHGRIKTPSTVSEINLLVHLILASLLWDIGKQNSPVCDAAKRGVPSEAILFAERKIVEKWNKILKSHLKHLKMKVDSSN